MLVLAGCQKKELSQNGTTSDEPLQTDMSENTSKNDNQKAISTIDENSNLTINIQCNDPVGFSFYKFNLETDKWEKVTDIIHRKWQTIDQVILYNPTYDGYIYMRMTDKGDFCFEDDYYVQAEKNGYPFKWIINDQAKLEVGKEIPVAYGVFSNQDVDFSSLDNENFIDFPIIMLTAEIAIPVY